VPADITGHEHAIEAGSPRQRVVWGGAGAAQPPPACLPQRLPPGRQAGGARGRCDLCTGRGAGVCPEWVYDGCEHSSSPAWGVMAASCWLLGTSVTCSLPTTQRLATYNRDAQIGKGNIANHVSLYLVCDMR